jgi:hypothetical protein
MTSCKVVAQQWENPIPLCIQTADLNLNCKSVQARLATQWGYVKREWVGLEKADMPDGDNPMYDHDYFIKGMVWADAKLREKNGGA